MKSKLEKRLEKNLKKISQNISGVENSGVPQNMRNKETEKIKLKQFIILFSKIINSYSKKTFDFTNESAKFGNLEEGRGKQDFLKYINQEFNKEVTDALRNETGLTMREIVKLGSDFSVVRDTQQFNIHNKISGNINEIYNRMSLNDVFDSLVISNGPVFYIHPHKRIDAIVEDLESDIDLYLNKK